MSERAPRPDSRLKNLPEDQQEQIIALLKKRKSFESAVGVLDAEFGVQTSATALRSFFSWWHLRERFRQRELKVATVIEGLASKRPELGQNQLFEIGQEMFSALAIESEDAKDWYRTQRLNMQRAALNLAREKFQRDTCEMFLKWYADERAVSVVEAKATNAEKIQRLRELMFADLDSEGPLTPEAEK